MRLGKIFECSGKQIKRVVGCEPKPLLDAQINKKRKNGEYERFLSHQKKKRRVIKW